MSQVFSQAVRLTLIDFLLHYAAGARQEVLNICNNCFGQICHSSVAATGGAVIEEIADASCRIFLQEVITGIVGFLRMQRKKKKGSGKGNMQYDKLKDLTLVVLLARSKKSHWPNARYGQHR